jgi:hypothetical protein
MTRTHTREPYAPEHPRSGYFLMRDSPAGKCILMCSEEKATVFAVLAQYEAAGVVCWVEDLRGEKVS